MASEEHTFNVTLDNRQDYWKRKLEMYKLTVEGNAILRELLGEEKKQLDLRLQIQTIKEEHLQDLMLIMQDNIDKGASSERLKYIIEYESKLQHTFADNKEVCEKMLAVGVKKAELSARLSKIQDNIKFIDDINNLSVSSGGSDDDAPKPVVVEVYNAKFKC
jgi:hypothetical protein